MPHLRLKSAALFALLSLTQAVAPCPAHSAASYKKEVLEIFRAECLGCHNEDDKQGELDLSTYDAVLRGGISGNVVEPGDPDESLLYRLVAHLDQPSMPPETPKIARESIAIIKQWIAEGAPNDTSDKPEKNANKGNLPVIAIPAARQQQEPIYPPRLPRGSHQVTERDPALVALAASPTSPVIAVGGVRQVWFIRIDTNERIGRIGFSGGDVQCLQFSADGSLLVVGGGYGGASGTVEIWDVEKGHKLFQKSDYLDSVTCVAISADHQRLAVASTAPKIDLIDLESGKNIKRLDKHTDWINAIKFSDDNVLLASADRAGGLQLWESWTGDHYRTLEGHKQSISDLEWTYDSNFIASSGKDGFIRIWSAEDGSESQKIKAHAGGVIRHARRVDGGWVSTGSDQILQIWSPEGESISAATPFADTPTSLAYAPSSRMILAGDFLGRLMRLDEDTLTPIKLPSINPRSLDMQIDLTREALNAARQKHS
ncbi:MAG: c-type cytochrome domain-containing protein [Planctomycetota bacterium]|nr:c-type cytochrome domain-containing protein [Planctomycetota bacterium]